MKDDIPFIFQVAWDKWNGNVHEDREYASLAGVEFL